MKKGIYGLSRQLVKKGYFNERELAAKMEYYGNKCWICKWRQACALDHVIPQSYKTINLLANIRPICKICNSAKATKYPLNIEMIRARYSNPQLSDEQRLINMAKIALNNLNEGYWVIRDGRRERVLKTRGNIILDDARILSKAIIAYFENS